MVLAATNRPSELDEAILRRFSQAFEIGLPDRKERVEILKVILKGERVEDNIDFDYLASLCEGYTGSDILELCKKAAYFPIRDLLKDEKKGKPSHVSASIADMFANILRFLNFGHYSLSTILLWSQARQNLDSKPYFFLTKNAFIFLLYCSQKNSYPFFFLKSNL